MGFHSIWIGTAYLPVLYVVFQSSGIGRFRIVQRVNIERKRERERSSNARKNDCALPWHREAVFVPDTPGANEGITADDISAQDETTLFVVDLKFQSVSWVKDLGDLSLPALER